jgi:hypothetical protein
MASAFPEIRLPEETVRLQRGSSPAAIDDDVEAVVGAEDPGGTRQ